MQPLISFIIPVYNCESYIEGCVKSILEGEWGETEIQVILIDDGSTDRSLQICNSLASKHPTTIEVHSQANAGTSAARNVGLANAKGEFVWFVDGDDRINTSEVPTIFNSLLQCGSNILCFNHLEETCDRVSVIPDILSTKTISASQYLLNSRSLYLWNKIYRRNCLSDIKFLEGTKNIEDFLFNIEVLINEDTIRLIDKSIYIYNRTNTNSTSRNTTPRNLVKLSQDTIKIHTRLIELKNSFDEEKASVITRLLAFSIGGYFFSLIKFYNKRHLKRAINFYRGQAFFPVPASGQYRMDIFLRLFNNSITRNLILGLIELLLP